MLGGSCRRSRTILRPSREHLVWRLAKSLAPLGRRTLGPLAAFALLLAAPGCASPAEQRSLPAAVPPDMTCGHATDAEIRSLAERAHDVVVVEHLRHEVRRPEGADNAITDHFVKIESQLGSDEAVIPRSVKVSVATDRSELVPGRRYVVFLLPIAGQDDRFGIVQGRRGIFDVSDASAVRLCASPKSESSGEQSRDLIRRVDRLA